MLADVLISVVYSQTREKNGKRDKLSLGYGTSRPMGLIRLL